jgi:ankyrin repeat protein
MDKADDRGPPDLHKACRIGDMDFIRFSYEANPLKINDRDKSLGWTPLYRTVICGHSKASRFLLKNGADPNLANNLGETPLH